MAQGESDAGATASADSRWTTHAFCPLCLWSEGGVSVEFLLFAHARRCFAERYEMVQQRIEERRTEEQRRKATKHEQFKNKKNH